MAFKEILKKKVPEDLQYTPEFKTLLAMIGKRGIRSEEALKMLLNVEIVKCKDWLDKNKTASTINRWRRHYTRRLDFCSLIKKKILPFLE